MTRPSILSTTVTPITGKRAKNPDPPSLLSDSERKIWDAVLTSVEQGWIPENQFPMLVAYCRHIAAADRLSQLIQYIESEDTMARINAEEDGKPDLGEHLKQLDKAYTMREREVRSATSIQTKLRLTNQSLRDNRSKKPTAKQRPWE